MAVDMKEPEYILNHIYFVIHESTDQYPRLNKIHLKTS